MLYHHEAKRKPQFPLAGMTAWLSIIFLTGSSAVILLASSKSPIDRWKIKKLDIEPQVWTAILSTVMDGLTMFAFAHGVAIWYWNAVSRGATLRQMHDLYESQAFLGALRSLFQRRPSIITWTCLLCMISTLRGPLFQRASSVDSNYVKQSLETRQLRIAQLLPPGYIYPNQYQRNSSCDLVYDLHLDRAPIVLNDSIPSSSSTSNGVVKGYGFDVHCSTSTIAWDATPNSTLRANFQDQNNQKFENLVPVFNSTASLPGYIESGNVTADRVAFLAAEANGWLEVSSIYKTNHSCGGDLSITKCLLHHAVVEYAIEIHGNTIQLQHPHYQNDTVISQTSSWNMFNDTDILSSLPFWGSTMQWANLHGQQFNQEVSIYGNNSGYVFLSDHDPRGHLAKLFVNGEFTPNCSTTFRDPTQYTLDRLRELAFRTAVAAANNVTDDKELFQPSTQMESQMHLIQNWTQNIELDTRETLAVYTVSIPFLVCAILTSLLAVAAVSPLFWGWTEIKEAASFNPLEVARAFDAPLLRDFPNHGIEEHIRGEEGLQKARYCHDSDKSAQYAMQWEKDFESRT